MIPTLTLKLPLAAPPLAVVAYAFYSLYSQSLKGATSCTR